MWKRFLGGFPIMNRQPVLSVSIVTYNTREMTLRCLKALFADLGDICAEVLVVDNASTDGSAEAISAAYPEVRLIVNAENAGFGIANNDAIALARGKYILLLNTDAFVHPGCCGELIRFMESHPDAGAVGARLENADESLQVSCFPFPTPFRCWIENLWISKIFAKHEKLGDYRAWAHDEVREVDWVVGACLMCRRDVVEDIGGFDPLFFMYSEETDLQQRMRRAGSRIYFTPCAAATHLGGASEMHKAATIGRFLASFDSYQLKNHRVAGFLLTRAAMVAGAVLRFCAWSVVWVFDSNSRGRAAGKLRHYRFLLARQLTAPMPRKRGGAGVS